MSLRIACLTSALALTTGQAMADMNFNRIASFPVVKNMAEGADTTRETSPEIIAATADGMTLVYTDSPLGVIGMVDITDPATRLRWARWRWVVSRPRSALLGRPLLWA